MKNELNLLKEIEILEKKKNTGTYSSWKAINEEHMLNDRMRSAEVDAEAQRVWSTVSPPDKK